MFEALSFFAGKLLLLIIGGAIMTWGVLLATYSPFQRWNYHRTEGAWPDVKSDKYQNDVANMRIAGSKGAFIGALMVIFALAQLGLLD
jgi:hypothetical protein